MGSNPIPSATLQGMMNSYHIWTIGCQMNTADSDRLAGALEQLGLSSVDNPRDADVVVLNSCVVRQSAEDKVVGTLGHMKPIKSKDPKTILALMGCMVGPKRDDLKARFPYVDVFMSPQEYKPLLDLIGFRLGVDWEGCIGTLISPTLSVTSYIPVIHGCDLMCSFCIIPYRRGRQVSRLIEDVENEVRLLVQRGVKEVTLLGQTVDAYGQDLPGTPDLADLLLALNAIPELLRIRFLTSHPQFMSSRIIDAVGSLEKVCEHINLPVQAGDDVVLTNMRRGYTQRWYRQLVHDIRSTIPGVSISTDVIVGFPGETREQYNRTVDLIKDMEFDKVHIAAYSDRPGTIASRKMVDGISLQEKDYRLKNLEEIQTAISKRRNATFLGKTVDILVDQRKNGRWQGRTRNDKLVFFSDEQHQIGNVVRVNITQTSPWSFQGELAHN